MRSGDPSIQTRLVRPAPPSEPIPLKSSTPGKRPPMPMTDNTWHVRQEILRRYGGCCGCPCGCHDTNLRHLQIDHMHNDGGVERTQKKVRGERYYVRLLNTPVDPTLQLLCANCHMEKTLFGECKGQKNQEDPLCVTGVTETPEESVHRRGLQQEGPTSSVVRGPFSHLDPETFRKADEARAAAEAMEQLKPRQGWLRRLIRRG